MNTTPFRVILMLAAPIALALSGCGNDGAPAAAAEAATQDSAPAATKPTAQEYAADYKINEPIAKADIATRISLVGKPVYLAQKDMIEFQVEVFNDGKVAIVSAGEKPVRLGINIAGPKGVDMAPGNRSFKRAMLPLIIPGTSAVVTGRAPVEPIKGLTLQVETLQEGVAWWGRGYKQPTLDIGQFDRCDGAVGTLCDAANQPLEIR